MAHGLWRHALGSGHAHHALDDQFKFVYGEFHPGRGYRGNSRRPVFSGAHAEGISSTARRFRCRTESDQGLLLPHAKRRLLRVSHHYEDTMEIEEARGWFARASWRGVSLRNCVW